MNILGISAFYHDSASCVIKNGKIIAAAQEERFTRKKNDSGFPIMAAQYCLKEARLSIDQLDAVVFYDKPLLKFERLLETYYAFSPKGFSSFLQAIPVWLRDKLFLKNLIRKELQKVGEYDKKKLKLLFPEHHLSHAASAFYPSPLEESAILTIDGIGEWATATICYGKGKDITILKELRFPHSVGLLYASFTYFLGFKVNSGEYKLMGLAPYGNARGENVKRFIEIIKIKLVEIKADGSIYLDQKYFNYAVGLRMVKDSEWEKLFGFKRREPEAELEQKHCDLAMAIQIITEEIVLKMAEEAKKLTGSNNLCMAGGVALNCVANGKLLAANIFKNIFVQPAAGDCGGAPGAALTAHHIYFQKERVPVKGADGMNGAFLGPEFSDEEIKSIVAKYNAQYILYSDFDGLAVETAKRLAEGNVIGWFQGRMEFGSRALGNRSILGDARNPEMQKKVNQKIKYRESFRPFAPAVLAEDAKKYFNLSCPSPYMLFVAPVNETFLQHLPPNYSSLSIREKLSCNRSYLPAVTHVDFSARIQTIHPETNKRFWVLANEFKKQTGCSVLLNTSFNVRGEPVVCTPEEAYVCFMRTEMDYLVLGNFLFDKRLQPAWKEKINWKEEYQLD